MKIPNGNKLKIILVRVNSSIETAPPPLGLMYIASYLRSKNNTLAIKIVDARNKDYSPEKLKSVILEYDPDFLGITSMHAEKNEVHALAGALKKIRPEITIALGGPYASADYCNAIKDKNIDFVISGEGEETLRELLEDSCTGYDNISAIKGLTYKHNDLPKFNGHRDFIDNLDNLPFPAWDLINPNDYFYGKKRSLENPLQIYKKAVPILSSRGCPYQCTYCHSIFGKKFRPRSPENILQEIKLLCDRYGVKEIEFLDDAFNIDKNRAKEILYLIIKEKLNIKICFSNGIRLDRIDDELLDLMKASGVYRINYGIESASERIQKLIRKNLDLGIVKDIISKTVKKGILCGGFFMIGFPSETEDEMIQTIRLACSSRLHTAAFGVVTPYPSTLMYSEAISKIGIENPVDFNDAQKISWNLSEVSNKKLEHLRYSAYRKFYFNPVRALKIFLSAPSKTPVFKNFVEVFKVAFCKKALYSRQYIK